MINRCWRFLVAFWSAPIRAEPVALFRILLGATALTSALLSLGPYLPRYLGPDGLCPADNLDPWLERTSRATLLRGPVAIPWRSALISDESAQAWAAWCERHPGRLFGAWVVALLCLTLGYWTRLASVASWALTVSFDNRLPWLTNGGDALLQCGLFYLMFARSGAVWSLDSLWRRWRAAGGQPRDAAPVLVPPWPIRLLQIQLCFVYLFTGLIKLGQDWFNGEAVYWVLNDVALVRWPYHSVPVPLWLCRLLSWGTLGFELGFTAVVLIRPLRPFLLLGGVMFHLGILLFTEVGYFSQVSLCWYVLFLDGESLARFFGRLLRQGSWVRGQGSEKTRTPDKEPVLP
jgi:hypothetical protein